jgi:hypothetical protein
VPALTRRANKTKKDNVSVCRGRWTLDAGRWTLDAGRLCGGGSTAVARARAVGFVVGARPPVTPVLIAVHCFLIPRMRFGGACALCFVLGPVPD